MCLKDLAPHKRVLAVALRSSDEMSTSKHDDKRIIVEALAARKLDMSTLSPELADTVATNLGVCWRTGCTGTITVIYHIYSRDLETTITGHRGQYSGYRLS